MSTMVQDMTRKKGFGWIIWIVRAFVENYVETSPPGKKNYVDFGPVNTVVSSNFIDKVRFRASAQTTANLSPHLFLKGYAAYGVRDKKWKYGIFVLKKTIFAGRVPAKLDSCLYPL